MIQKKIQKEKQIIMVVPTMFFIKLMNQKKTKILFLKIKIHTISFIITKNQSILQ